MTFSSRHLIVPMALGLSAFILSNDAAAADIVSTVGSVGSAAWQAACPGAQVAPSGTSQLPNCAGGGADCLHRVVIDPAEFPNATCSDGTPGVFYVRAGSNGDENRWVVHLQGGGACRDYDSCLERWCGQQGNLPYTANKMSSDWNADGITDLHEHAVGPGMASADPANEFSTWTHVWAYYCSSDSWQGTQSDVTFSNGAASFDLDARGHTVLSAMRRMLRKNNANASWTAADDYEVPDLDDASEIVFTGTSAGAHGAMANADWFLTPFTSSDNSLVVDANFDIDDWVTVLEDLRADEDLDGAGDEWWATILIEQILDQWDVGGYYDLIGAFHDETCKNAYFGQDRMDRCDIAPILMVLNSGASPMIETPTFVRLDLEDNVLRKTYTQHPNRAGISALIGPGFGAPQTDVDDYARMARASVLEAYLDHDSVTGVFAPRCGAHVGLESGYQFAQVTTPDTDDVTMLPVAGTATSFHDALWDWLNVGGGGTRSSIRRFDTNAPGAAFSGC